MNIKSVVLDKKVIIGVSIVGVAGAGYIFYRRSKSRVTKYVQLTIFDDGTTPHYIESGAEVDYTMDEDLEVSTPVEVEVNVEEVMLDEMEPETVEVVEPEPAYRVFKSRPSSWDMETELSTRKSHTPYIIHKDEYLEDEMGFRQITATYYEQDDILADEEDTPVYNYGLQLGELKFGHGSEDPNVVYIRNETARTEWEVIRHTGSFAYEVLGEEFAAAVEKELKHSVQKFRPE